MESKKQHLIKIAFELEQEIFINGKIIQTDGVTDLSKLQIDDFSDSLLTWFDHHGRHHLPWQQHRTDSPNVYHVWLSEVMLQQTQVKTVIPYFLRFVESFPTVQALANAHWDQVAEHWAGLGYYARARNLHKGAKQLADIIEACGDFPKTVAEWQDIAGVGPSTAGAIVAMGLHGYGVICDGNVKRVLTRWAGIDGDINKSATNKVLWQLAEQLTPTDNSKDFAQAMMDMGATVCNRTKPACLHDQRCPLQATCIAHSQGEPLSYPVKSKKSPKPSKYSNALIIINSNHQYLWLQRPETGIWGGLWSLPLQFTHKIDKKKTITIESDNTLVNKEFTSDEHLTDHFLQSIQPTINQSTPLIKHTLTHFHWYLNVQTISLSDCQSQQINEKLDDQGSTYCWLNPDQVEKKLALPKAMLTILQTLD